MTRTLRLVLLAVCALLALARPAHATLQPYTLQTFGAAFGSGAQALPGATVTVYNYGTSTKSNLYTFSGGTCTATALSNPLTADSNGLASFCADSGTQYQATWSLGTYTSPTVYFPTNLGTGGGGSSTLTANSTATSGFSAGQLFYSDGSHVLQALGQGSSGQFLESQGASAVPIWATPGGGGNVSTSGTITANTLPCWASTTTVASIAAGSSGQVLQSNGAGSCPSWTSAGGGPGSGTQYYVAYWSGSSTLGSINPSTAGYVLTSNGGSAAPTFQSFTSVTANGNNSFTGNNTHTGSETFSGTTSNEAAVFTNMAEPSSVSGSALGSSWNFDFSTSSIYVNNASAQTNNWGVNFRFSSGTSLNSAMSTGQTITAVVLVHQGVTPYYNTSVSIDGTALTAGTNLFWQGGNAPAAGNASGYDVYTYSITKTGSATYIVLASMTMF